MTKESRRRLYSENFSLLSGRLSSLLHTNGGLRLRNTTHFSGTLVLLLEGLSLHLLLHQEIVDLLDVLVQEFAVRNETFEVLNTVKQASSDFTGHFAVDVMDREVNCISNKLQPFATVRQCLKIFNLNLREANLCHLWGRYWSWLRRLLLSDGLGRWEICRYQRLVRCLGLHVSASIHWVHTTAGLLAISTRVASSVATTAVVSLATSTLLELSLVLVVSSLIVLRHSTLILSTKVRHASHLVLVHTTLRFIT